MALYRQKPITRHFVELCRNYWEFSISMWNMASSDLLLFMFKIETTTRGTNFMPFPFSDGIIYDLHRGSFAFRDHLRSNLGIISGLGSICGRGSFAALYRPPSLSMTSHAPSYVKTFSLSSEIRRFDKKNSEEPFQGL